MAAQFDTSKVVLQPTQQEAPLQTNVFEYGAQVAAQIGGYALQDATQQAQKSTQLYASAINTASAGFDRGLAEYNKYAEQKANEDAPASIKYDANNNIIPPSSFYPPGISTRAYGETYAAASRAQYRSSAEQELVNYSAVMKEKYAADPVAYRAAMAEKRQAMQQNLDPTMKPWIDLRGQQIESQGITVLAVQSQSVRNKVLQEGVDRDLRAVEEDAGRTAASHPVVQGGGGSPAALDNNVGNITVSGDSYHGGKGLPVNAPSGLKFETFQSAEHGVAAAHNLIARRVKEAGGTLSFAELVNKWDPKAAPDVKANYAAALAKAADALPNAAIPIDDPAKMAQVLKAMNRFEKGKQTVSDTAFENGVKLAKGDTSVPLTGAVTDKPQAAAADVKATQDAATAAVNSNIMAERIRDIRVRAQAAGEDPALTERKIVEMRFKTEMRAIGDQIRNSSQSLYGKDGNLDQGAVAATEERIAEISKRYPGREVEVTEKLRGDLQFAQTQASRQAAQIKVDDQRLVSPQIRQMTADAAAAKVAALNGDSVQAQAITQRLEAQGRSFLNNPSLSDSVAMSLSQAAFQNGSLSRGAMQESFTNRLQSLNAVIADPIASPERKAAAYGELHTIRDDPALAQDLTASQRSYAQSGMDTYNRANIAGDLAQVSIIGNNGGITPLEGRQVLAKHIAQGNIGNHPGAIMNVAQAAALEKGWVDAYNAKETERRLATDGLAAAQNGQILTDDQKKALAEKHKFDLGGGRKTYDPNANPQDLQKLTDYYRTTTLLPDSVKQAATSMQRSADPAQMAGWIGTHQAIYDVEAERYAKAHKGQTMPADVGNARVAAVLGTDAAGYLAFAKKWGADAAFKTFQADATSTSKSGQAGQPAGAMASSLDAALDRVVGAVVDTAGQTNTLQKLVTQPGRIFGGWQNTPEERGALAAVTVRQGETLPSGTRVTIDNDVRAHLKEGATVYLATDGKAIRDQKGDKDAETFALSVQIEKAKEAGLIETRVLPNGDAVVSFKTLPTVMAERLGLTGPMTPGAERGSLDALIQGERTRLGMTGTDYDPSSLKATTRMDQNGNLKYHISVSDRNGIPLTQMEIGANDPRINAETKALERATMVSLRGAGYVGTDEQMTRSAGMIGRFKQSMDDWLFRDGRVNTILQNASARNLSGDLSGMNQQDIDDIRNFQVEYQRRIQALQAELGPNGPDAARVLQEMNKGGQLGPTGTIMESFGAGQKPPVRSR